MLFCHFCHGEYKVREFWEGRTRVLFCSVCYAHYKRSQRLVGVKTPPWSKLQRPPDSERLRSVLFELGPTRYQPGRHSTYGGGGEPSEAVCAVVSVYEAAAA